MAESKNRSFCSVPECSCSARKQPYLSFHSFPRDPQLRKIWVQAIRRDEGPGFRVLKGSTYVCSRHFTLEDYFEAGSSRLKNGVVPSRFSWNNFVAPQKRKKHYERTSDAKHLAAEETASSSGVSVKAATDASRLDHDYVFHPPAGALDEALEYIQDLEARLANVPLPSHSLFSRFCASDDQIRFYTKFPSEEVFRIFWESVAPSASLLVYWTKAKKMGDEACLDPSPPRSMPLIDEFLLYCMCVAVGMKDQVIADMFNVSITTVSRLTITWANYLFIVLSSLPIWTSREKVKSSMPLKLRKHCPNVRVILDCTKLTIETASSMKLKPKTFSNGKNRTTLKGLIGVAPCGSITFISHLYTGSISDRELTRISGVLSLLEPGDDIMADKGFLIQDLLDDVGARLIISPFKHGVELTKDKTDQTEAIALLRVTVERVMARVKSFHIWDSPLPLTLIGTVNQIWHNCCVLANYQGPLCVEG